jgi:bloom syndrome protein
MRNAGINCDYFCGGSSMDNNEREDKRKKWQNGGIKVMVSTTAFGMGIDNKDVRFVFHADLPKSITDYYQGTGRAGRDGQRSDVILFYKISDRKTLLHFIHSCTSEENKASSFMDLYNLIEFCEEQLRCRKVMISEHFEGKVDGNCGDMCDNCIERAQSRIEVFEKDYYNEVKIVLDLLKRRNDWTIRKLENALTDKGYNKDSAVRLYPEYGKLKDIQSLPRLLNKMLEQKLIREEAIDTMREIKNSPITNIVSYLKPIDSLIEEKLHLKLSSGKYSMNIEVMSLDSDLELIDPEGQITDLDDDLILITDLPSKRARESL